MSYEIERRVLQNYCQSQSFFGLDPFGLDGSPVTLADDSGFMTIVHGNARQTSTGAPGANCHEYAGVIKITIVTPGKSGARGATTFIDTIIAAFTGLKLDQDGNTPSITSTVVIDFGRQGLVAHVSSKTPEGPYLRTVMNCPFVRTERK